MTSHHLFKLSNRNALLVCCLLFNSLFTFAQTYTDFVGAGHNNGITVTSSSDLSQNGWTKIASGEKTINGDGLDGRLSEAARFLSQSSIAYDLEEIQKVTDMGIEAWIDEQMTQPYRLYLPMITGILEDFNDYKVSIGDPVLWDRPYNATQRTTWWRMNMQERDFLRDKLAFAWSEIMVISTRSELAPMGFSLMDYLDIFKRNAFGNFRDILLEVALHPAMGSYLSHLHNRKVDPVLNIHPDQNFAREIMQLFSIGLHVLNNDGTPKTNADNSYLPSYSQNDIEELAKVFTGLGAGGGFKGTAAPAFGSKIWFIDMTEPMVMYQEHHDETEKVLLDSLTIPAGQDGMADIEMAVDFLFKHSNTGPFMCKRMIQRLVKSNPTPAYVDRVATVFNADENGVRGNMEAVIKAILLDEEARNCEWISDPSQGKLRSPTERSIHFTRVVDLDIESGEVWNDAEKLLWQTRHRPLEAPSVFNFHGPEYQPPGDMATENLIGPEFEMFHTSTALGYANMVNKWLYIFNSYGRGGDVWQSAAHIMRPNLSSYLEDAQDSEALLNELDLRFTNGNLTPHTRAVIKNLIDSMDPNDFPNPAAHWSDYQTERIKQVIYMLMISPDFNIVK